MKKTIVVVLALILLLGLTGCKSSDYKSAVSAFEAGNFETALKAFSGLSEYKDSATYIQKCDYAIALADFSAGEFEKAKSEFEALGAYENSLDYVTKCAEEITKALYESAVAEFEAGNYEAAIEELSKLDGYGDSVEYVEKAENAIVQAKLIGTWKTDKVPFQSIIEMMLGEDDILDEVIQDHTMTTLSMEAEVVFYDDGTYEITANIDGVDGFANDFNTITRDYFVRSLEKACEDSGITLQEAYDYYGTTDINEIFKADVGITLDQYLEILDIKGQLEEVIEEATESGTYSVEDNVIYFDGGSGEVMFDSDAMTLTLDSGLENLLETGILVFNKMK